MSGDKGHTWIRTALLGLGLTVLCFWARGYAYNVRDQTVFLPYLQHTLFGVPFAADDLLMRNIRGVSGLHLFLGPLAGLMPDAWKTDAVLEWGVFLLYSGSLYAVQMAVFVLARKLTGSTWGGVLAAALFALLESLTPFLPGPLEDYLSSRTMALALTLWALVSLAGGRHVLGCALAGLSVNVNPTMATPLLLLCVWEGLVRMRERRTDLRVWFGFGVMLALVLPWLLHAARLGFSVHPLHPSAAWRTVATRRFGFLDFHKWTLIDWIRVCTPIVIFAVTARLGGGWRGAARPLHRLLLIACGLFVVHVALQAFSGAFIALQAQLLRAYTYVPMLLAIRAAELVWAQHRTDTARCCLALALFFGVLLGLDVVAVPAALLLPIAAGERGRARLLLLGGLGVAFAVTLGFVVWQPAGLAPRGESYFNGVYWGIALLLTLLFAVLFLLGVGRQRIPALAAVAVTVIGLLMPAFAYRTLGPEYADLKGRVFLRFWFSIPGLRPQTPFEKAAVWLRDNTPADAVCLTPFQVRGFRGFSRRTPFYLWKDGCLGLFDEGYAARWLALFERYDGGVQNGPFGQIDIRRDVPADVRYVVIPNSALAEAHDKALGEALYVNEEFSVYRRAQATAARPRSAESGPRPGPLPAAPATAPPAASPRGRS
ncbi:MAG: hypothetical protein JXR37_03380 [Kiritimatiellae bacterium]|nr:hypothetical protein [Kiritimatiellia bacterium]